MNHRLLDPSKEEDKRYLDSIVKIKEEFRSAIKRNDSAEVRRLLSQVGFDPEYQDCEGRSYLHGAAADSGPEVVEVLLDYGWSGDVSRSDGRTPMHLAAKSGQADIVALLHMRGYSIKVTDYDGYTPLLLAAKYGKALCVKYLSNNSTEVIRTKSGKLPIHLAALNGHAEAIRALVANGADVNAKSTRGCHTALHCAAENGHVGVISTLAELGADINAANARGLKPIHSAAKSSVASYKRLVELGAIQDDVTTTHGLSVLHIAVSAPNIELVRHLLENKIVRVDSADMSGRSPLHCAAREGNLEVMELLIAAGADLNRKTYYCRQTPLDMARENANVTAVELLEKHGAVGESTEHEHKESYTPSGGVSSVGASQSTIIPVVQTAARTVQRPRRT